MNKFTKGLSACMTAIIVASGAMAEPADDNLVINEDIEIVTRTAAPAHLSDVMDEVMSGWLFRGEETRAMERDDFDTPGMIFVEKAEETWNTADGTEGKSCADCHGASSDMSAVRPVYPKYVEAAGEVRTLEMQINYYTRFGQLELSCANCHEDNYGNMIRADHLSQGQINGFPAYRLKNSKLNAVQDRFKGCVRDTRAETFAPGSPEFVALELYVGSRGNGLSVEGPSVRN